MQCAGRCLSQWAVKGESGNGVTVDVESKARSAEH